MISDLLEKLEAAEGPDRELDAQIELALDFPNYRFPKAVLNRKPQSYQEALERLTHDGFGSGRSPRRYTASLDAAVGLVPEGWSGGFEFGPTSHGVQFDANLWNGKFAPDAREVAATANTPALALCIAALKAREKQDEA